MKRVRMKSLTLALGTFVLLGPVATHAADSAREHSDNDNQKSGSVGQYVDDATITARVKSRFASDSTISATRIKVDTVKGIVELSGRVTSETERDQAVTIAKGVPDVRGVRNNLTVQRSPAKSEKPSS